MFLWEQITLQLPNTRRLLRLPLKQTALLSECKRHWAQQTSGSDRAKRLLYRHGTWPETSKKSSNGYSLGNFLVITASKFTARNGHNDAQSWFHLSPCFRGVSNTMPSFSLTRVRSQWRNPNAPFLSATSRTESLQHRGKAQSLLESHEQDICKKKKEICCAGPHLHLHTISNLRKSIKNPTHVTVVPHFNYILQ